MIDAEVIRLRQLRRVALKVRAIAVALDSPALPGGSLFALAAVSCWRISSVVTGRLRAHPYVRYQRGPAYLHTVGDRLMAVAVSRLASRQGRCLRTFSWHLHRLGRELDDARALTWSPDLGDTLGRSQDQLRKLTRQVDSQARQEAGVYVEGLVRVHRAPHARRHAAGREEVADSWPYLTI